MPGIETLEKKKRVDDDTSPPISTIDPKVVLDNVFKQLGKPPTLAAISGNLTRAVPMDQHTFRVQIFIHEKSPVLFGSITTLAHSLWVKVNDKGEIIRSDPAINKKY